jgi:hypothetical protein
MLTDSKLNRVFEVLEAGDIKPKQSIFFEGQFFDAYVFVADLIKSATKSIVLIGNYIDETAFRPLKRSAKSKSSSSSAKPTYRPGVRT